MSMASDVKLRALSLLSTALFLSSMLSASQVVVVDMVELPPADESTWFVKDFTTSRSATAAGMSYLASTYPTPTVYEMTSLSGLPQISHQADGIDIAVARDSSGKANCLIYDFDLNLTHQVFDESWHTVRVFPREQPSLGQFIPGNLYLFRDNSLGQLQFAASYYHYLGSDGFFLHFFGGISTGESGTVTYLSEVDPGTEFLDEVTSVRCAASQGMYSLETRGSFHSSETIFPLMIRGSGTTTVRILNPGSITTTVVAYTQPKFPDDLDEEVFIFERTESGAWGAEELELENDSYFVYGWHRFCRPLSFVRGDSGAESMVFQDQAGSTVRGQLRLAFRPSKQSPWSFSTILRQKAQTDFGSEITQFMPQAVLVSPEGACIESLGVSFAGSTPDFRYASTSSLLFIRAVNFEGLDWQATPATSLGAILEYVNPAEALPETWQSNTDPVIDIADYIGRHKS